MSHTLKHPTEILVQVSPHETIIYTVTAQFVAVIKAILDSHDMRFVLSYGPRPRPKMTLERAVEVAKKHLTKRQIGKIVVERRKTDLGLRGFKGDVTVFDTHDLTFNDQL